MKIVETHDVVRAGAFPKSAAWRKACKQVAMAVKEVDWPHGSGKFTIYDEHHGSGVKPIKEPCIQKLVDLGWQTEGLPPDKQYAVTTGDLDALIQTSAGYIGFEWETGNISSSHRALNKLVLALMRKDLVGGLLVVPSDEMKFYLTDRIGNIGELKAYFPLWSAVPVKNGALRIVVVEHDAVSKRVPPIPKGTDGRALV